MKKFKTKVIAVMLIVTLALTGCAKVEETIVINADGSGVDTATVNMDKQAYMDAVKELYTSMGMSMTEQEQKELEASLIKEGYKLVTIDGKEYYQMTETENIKAGKLNSYYNGLGTAYVTTDTVYIAVDTGNAVDDIKESQNLGFNVSADSIEYTMTIQLPNPIVSTNGTIDAANPNRVTFKVPLDKNSVIFATSKTGVTTSSVQSTIKKLNTVKATKIKKLKADKIKKKAKKATVTLKFKKVKGAEEYEIQYSTKKNFKGATTKTTKKTTYTLKNLKKGKKYYVRVRAMKLNYADVAVYSKWVKKSVKTKK